MSPIQGIDTSSLIVKYLPLLSEKDMSPIQGIDTFELFAVCK